jgi:hypothetical protein
VQILVHSFDIFMSFFSLVGVFSCLMLWCLMLACCLSSKCGNVDFAAGFLDARLDPFLDRNSMHRRDRWTFNNS